MKRKIHITIEMPFIELGNTLTLKLPQDPEFIFPDSYWTFPIKKIDIFKNEFYLSKDGKSYKFKTCRGGDSRFILTPIGLETWILKTNEYSCLVYILNNKVIKCDLSCFYHIVETGIYQLSRKNINFFNFETKETSELNCNGYDVYFHKNYIFSRENRTIYINTENLPQDIDLNLLLQKPDLRIFPEKKVKVNFTDVLVLFSVTDLLIFESVFINDQLENQDEIFLDMEYSEFNIQNIKTAIYLRSGTVYRSLLLDSFSEFSLEYLYMSQVFSK